MNIEQNVSERLRNRDSSAIDDLIVWYQPLLREMADQQLDVGLRRKVGVSDIVQEVSTDVFRGFSSLKAVDRVQFYAYLRSVMHNTLEDARRRFKRTAKRRIRLEVALSQSRCANLHEHVDNRPIEKMMNDETYQQLRNAIIKLPSELQRLLRWRFQEQTTYKDIGLKLSRSEDDVRMLIKRCLARIRPEISSDGSSQ